MLAKHLQRGGRAFALGVFAITSITLLGSAYMLLLAWAVVAKGAALTPDLLGPVSIIVVALAGLGGAPQLPNIAERIGGKGQAPPPHQPEG